MRKLRIHGTEVGSICDGTDVPRMSDSLAATVTRFAVICAGTFILNSIQRRSRKEDNSQNHISIVSTDTTEMSDENQEKFPTSGDGDGAIIILQKSDSSQPPIKDTVPVEPTATEETETSTHQEASHRNIPTSDNVDVGKYSSIASQDAPIVQPDSNQQEVLRVSNKVKQADVMVSETGECKSEKVEQVPSNNDRIESNEKVEESELSLELTNETISKVTSLDEYEQIKNTPACAEGVSSSTQLLDSLAQSYKVRQAPGNSSPPRSSTQELLDSMTKSVSSANVPDRNQNIKNDSDDVHHLGADKRSATDKSADARNSIKKEDDKTLDNNNVNNDDASNPTLNERRITVEDKPDAAPNNTKTSAESTVDPNDQKSQRKIGNENAKKNAIPQEPATETKRMSPKNETKTRETTRKGDKTEGTHGINNKGTGDSANITVAAPVPHIQITDDDIDYLQDYHSDSNKKPTPNNLNLVERYMAERSGGESEGWSSDSAASYSSNCSACRLQTQKRIQENSRRKSRYSSSSSTSSTSSSSSSSSSNSSSESSVFEEEISAAKVTHQESSPPIEKSRESAVKFLLHRTAGADKNQLPQSPWPGKKLSDPCVDNQAFRLPSSATPRGKDLTPQSRIPNLPTSGFKSVTKEEPLVIHFSPTGATKPRFGILYATISYDSSAVISSLDANALGNLNILVSKCEELESNIDATKLYVKFNILENTKSTPHRGKLGIGAQSKNSVSWDKDILIRNVPLRIIRNGVLRASIVKRETLSDRCLASCNIELSKQQRFGRESHDVGCCAEWIAVRRKILECKLSLH